MIYLVEGIAAHTDRLARLGKHRTGKVCLYIKRLSDVDTAVVADLLQSSYDYVMSRGSELGRAAG